MKKLSFALLFVFGVSFANNTNPNTLPQSEPKVGDVLVVNATSNTKYNHVFFPKLNFIVKKGNLATYKPVHGTEVVVKDVENKNGNTYVILEKKDNSKFFGYVKQVKANYSGSLNSGELSKM